MKKYLIALAVALMVCMLGISASAEERSTDSEEYKAAEREQEAIAQECYKIIDEINPERRDVRTQMRIMSEVYEKAGWTVTKETPEMARGTRTLTPKSGSLPTRTLTRLARSRGRKSSTRASLSPTITAGITILLRQTLLAM